MSVVPRIATKHWLVLEEEIQQKIQKGVVVEENVVSIKRRYFDTEIEAIRYASTWRSVAGQNLKIYKPEEVFL